LYNPQLYFLHLLYCGLYNPQYKTFFKYIAGCTTCNTKFFLNTLWVVQLAMYLKKILYYGMTNLLLWCNDDYHVSLIPKGLQFDLRCKANVITTITPQQLVVQLATCKVKKKILVIINEGYFCLFLRLK